MGRGEGARATSSATQCALRLVAHSSAVGCARLGVSAEARSRRDGGGGECVVARRGSQGPAGRPERGQRGGSLEPFSDLRGPMLARPAYRRPRRACRVVDGLWEASERVERVERARAGRLGRLRGRLCVGVRGDRGSCVRRTANVSRTPWTCSPPSDDAAGEFAAMQVSLAGGNVASGWPG